MEPTDLQPAELPSEGPSLSADVPLAERAQQWLSSLSDWATELPGWAQIVGATAAGVVLLLIAIVAVRRLLRRGMRTTLVTLACVSFVIASGFGIWVAALPETKGSYFVMWHQVVRGGGVLFTVAFIVLSMALSLPWLLNRVEASGGAIGFVSARHVRSSKSGFLTVISILSVSGVFLSSLALVGVISVMGGFGADLKRKILGNNAHISVDRAGVGGFGDWDTVLDDVRTVDGVQAATPVAQGEAMASSNSNTAGVIIRGIETDSVGAVIDLVKNVEVGQFDYLEDTETLADLPPDTVVGIGPGGHEYLKGPSIGKSSKSEKKKAKNAKGGEAEDSAVNDSAARDGDELDLDELDSDVKDILRNPDEHPGLIVGRELAKSLHVLVGDEVRLVAPLGDLGPMGVMPRTKRFRIAAIFYSGMYEYDASHVYMTLDNAQEFLDLQGKVTHVEVKVTDAEDVTPVRDLVATGLAERELRIRDWKELNRNLFSALKLEKIATFIILSVAIVVACFCIICTLLLMVTEKSKEIAIIKALGASDYTILRIFMLEGLMIGGVGTLFGVATGWVAAEGLKQFGVKLDPEVYYVDRLPIQVDPVDYGLVAICALVITVLATIGPARQAAQLRPVDGIRYE